MILLRSLVYLFIMISMLVPPAVKGATLPSQFHTSLGVKEEYTDNVRLSSQDKKSDYITTIQPRIKYSNADKVSGIDLDYLLGLVFYGRDSDFNYISHDAQLQAKYLTAGHLNFFFRDSFIRSNEPREREFFTSAEDNKFVLATTEDRQVYWRNVAAPTVEYQFGSENRLGLNYRNNLYRTDSTDSEDSQENYINPYLSYWFNQQNGISLDYGYTDGSFETDPDLTGHSIHARYTNRISGRYSIYAEHTFLRRSYASPGIDYDVNEPALGVTMNLSSNMTALIQVGYYWMDPAAGPQKSGVSYKGEIRSTDPRVTYQVSLQGGYREDLFTSDNLGFTQYHRLTGSLTHHLDRRTSVGLLGNIERADYINRTDHASDVRDTIWGVRATASHMVLRWLTIAFEASHREDNSDDPAAEYTENSVMFKIDANF
jgi:hypothetical protein